MLSPRLLCASVSQEREGGRRSLSYRDWQTFVCGDLFVTLGYFVCTVLEVGFRAVPSGFQAVLAVVGGFPPAPAFMIYYLVCEVGLNFRVYISRQVLERNSIASGGSLLNSSTPGRIDPLCRTSEGGSYVVLTTWPSFGKMVVSQH